MEKLQYLANCLADVGGSKLLESLQGNDGIRRTAQKDQLVQKPGLPQLTGSLFLILGHIVHRENINVNAEIAFQPSGNIGNKLGSFFLEMSHIAGIILIL